MRLFRSTPDFHQYTNLNSFFKNLNKIDDCIKSFWNDVVSERFMIFMIRSLIGILFWIFIKILMYAYELSMILYKMNSFTNNWWFVLLDRWFGYRVIRDNISRPKLLKDFKPLFSFSNFFEENAKRCSRTPENSTRTKRLSKFYKKYFCMWRVLKKRRLSRGIRKIFSFFPRIEKNVGFDDR